MHDTISFRCVVDGNAWQDISTSSFEQDQMVFDQMHSVEIRVIDMGSQQSSRFPVLRKGAG